MDATVYLATLWVYKISFSASPARRGWGVSRREAGEGVCVCVGGCVCGCWAMIKIWQISLNCSGIAPRDLDPIQTSSTD